MPLRLGPQVQAVLLPVRIRPFLSHKRANALAISQLRGELQLRGAGGWKDTEDLRLGADTPEAIVHAIDYQTGGFIWYGTQKALESEPINKLEIPQALKRASRDPNFTVTPVFVDISPKADKQSIRAAMGRRCSEQMLRRNGIERSRREPLGRLMRRVARRYVQDAIIGMETSFTTAVLTVFRPTWGDHDLTLDWRAIFDEERRSFREGGLELAIETLTDIRESLQRRSSNPLVRVELYLPLPIALLVGYQWRFTTGLRLEVLQPRGEQTVVVESGRHVTWAPQPPSHMTWSREGPAVVAVGVGEPLETAGLLYSDQVQAKSLDVYNVPGLVGAKELLGLTAAVVRHLRYLNDSGIRKHLLVRGPCSLAFLLGAALNATGPTVAPFWNGVAYVNPLVIGAPKSES